MAERYKIITSRHTIADLATTTLTQLSTVVDFDAWKSLYTNGSSVLTELALGAQYTVLQSGGAAAAPSFALLTNDSVAASGVANVAWNKLAASGNLGYAVITDPATGYLTTEQYLAVGRGGTGTGALTAGSVVFAGAGGVYSQDNSNLFWDDTNNRIGINAAHAPAVSADIHTRDATDGIVGVLRLTHNSSISKANTAGAGLALWAENEVNAEVPQSGIGSYWNSMAAGTEDGVLGFYTRTTGAGWTQQAKLSSLGLTLHNAYTFPVVDSGVSGYALVSNAAGVISWGAPTASAHEHDWTDITSGVPTEFPPEAHEHDWTDITSGVPAEFPPEAHEHAWGDITSGVPTEFTPEAHTHAGSDITSGTVGVTYGGTGVSSWVKGDLVYASNTNELGAITAVTAGRFLVSNGAGVVPYYPAAADLTWDEANNQLGIGTSAPSTRLHLYSEDATTNAVLDVLTIDRGVTGAGVGAAGLGAGIALRLENGKVGGGVMTEAGRINAVWTDATDGSVDSRLDLGVMHGNTPTTRMSIAETGIVTLSGYTTLGLMKVSASGVVGYVADGGAGKYLKTDGAGTWTWDTPAASVTAPLTLTVDDANRATSTTVLTLEHTTTDAGGGDPLMAVQLDFALEDDNGSHAAEVAAGIRAEWVSAASGAEAAMMVFGCEVAGSVSDCAALMPSAAADDFDTGLCLFSHSNDVGIFFDDEANGLEIWAANSSGILSLGGAGVATLSVAAGNHRVGVMNSSPAYPLDVTGEIHTSTNMHTPKAMMDAGGGLRVKLTNKTGANSVLGRWVTTSSTTDNAVGLGGASDHVLGVMAEAGVADGDEVWIWIGGRCQVLMQAASGCTRGQLLETSDTTNYTAAVGSSNSHIGRALTTTAANGLAWCRLNPEAEISV